MSPPITDKISGMPGFSHLRRLQRTCSASPVGAWSRNTSRSRAVSPPGPSRPGDVWRARGPGAGRGPGPRGTPRAPAPRAPTVCARTRSCVRPFPPTAGLVPGWRGGRSSALGSNRGARPGTRRGPGEGQRRQSRASNEPSEAPRATSDARPGPRLLHVLETTNSKWSRAAPRIPRSAEKPFLR